MYFFTKIITLVISVFQRVFRPIAAISGIFRRLPAAAGAASGAPTLPDANIQRFAKPNGERAA